MAKTRRRSYTNRDIDENFGPGKYSIPDLKNFKRNDRVWFQISDYDDTIGTGLIKEIYNFPDSGICVSVWEDKFGSWRVYPVSKISTKKMRKKRRRANNEFQDAEFSISETEE